MAGICFGFSSLAFAPGIIDGDGVAIFREAQSFHIGDWHSPVLTLLWGVLHRIIPGPIGLYLLLQAAYWGGLGLSGTALWRWGAPIAGCFFVAAGAFPASLILSITLIKDTALVSFLLLAVGLACWKELLLRRGSTLFISAVIPVIFLALASRANSLFAIFPITVLIVSLRTHICPFSRRVLATAALWSILLLVAVAVVNSVFIRAERTHPIATLQIFDLAGITAVSGRDQFASVGVSNGIAQTLLCYDPKEMDAFVWGACSSVYYDLRRQTIPTGRLTSQWLRAILTEPIAYFRHRFQHFGVVLRLQPNVFMPAPMWRSWIANAEQYQFRLSLLYDQLEKISVLIGRSWMGRPYLWCIPLTLGMILGARRRNSPAGILLLCLCSSGLLYMFGYLAVGLASHFRYMFWSMMSAVLSIPLITHFAVSGASRKLSKPVGGFANLSMTECGGRK
jgi:hypothetical protein